jgi:pimeloyl-ACP methyl ester carboxylesterase
MASFESGMMTRVTSRDGTEIAVWTSGEGPPLVLVHGAPADHIRWRPLLPHLEPHVTVHAIDRRGRGASGDGSEYRLEREYEDVAAVVDAVAAATRARVDVYGHSHGGIVAFGAATLTSQIRRLVLYEGWPVPDPLVYALPAAVEERMDELLAADDRDGVVEALFRSMDMSDEDLTALRSAPSWPGRVAAAHTVTREIRGETGARLDPDQAAKIRVPVLLLTGEDSTDPAKPQAAAVATALPDARVQVIEGQQHVGDILEPERFVGRLLRFLHASATVSMGCPTKGAAWPRCGGERVVGVSHGMGALVWDVPGLSG